MVLFQTSVTKEEWTYRAVRMWSLDSPQLDTSGVSLYGLNDLVQEGFSPLPYSIDHEIDICFVLATGGTTAR